MQRLRLLVVTFFTIFLVACGGSGSDGKSHSTTTIYEDSSTNSTIIQHTHVTNGSSTQTVTHDNNSTTVQQQATVNNGSTSQTVSPTTSSLNGGDGGIQVQQHYKQVYLFQGMHLPKGTPIEVIDISGKLKKQVAPLDSNGAIMFYAPKDDSGIYLREGKYGYYVKVNNSQLLSMNQIVLIPPTGSEPISEETAAFMKKHYIDGETVALDIRKGNYPYQNMFKVKTITYSASRNRWSTPTTSYYPDKKTIGEQKIKDLMGNIPQ